VPTTGPNLRSKHETPPVEPLAATKHTRAGANAFAKFFILTIDWAYATTSTTYMCHYFDPACVACRSAVAGIKKANRQGHHFVGDRFTVRSVNGIPGHGSNPAARVQFDVESTEVVDTNDDYVDSVPALHDFQERIYVFWRQNAWTVTEMIPKAGT
jgi:hypothetical protein